MAHLFNNGKAANIKLNQSFFDMEKQHKQVLTETYSYFLIFISLQQRPNLLHYPHYRGVSEGELQNVALYCSLFTFLINHSWSIELTY